MSTKGISKTSTLKSIFGTLPFASSYIPLRLPDVKSSHPPTSHPTKNDIHAKLPSVPRAESSHQSSKPTTSRSSKTQPSLKPIKTPSPSVIHTYLGIHTKPIRALGVKPTYAPSNAPTYTPTIEGFTAAPISQSPTISPTSSSPVFVGQLEMSRIPTSQPTSRPSKQPTGFPPRQPTR